MVKEIIDLGGDDDDDARCTSQGLHGDKAISQIIAENEHLKRVEVIKRKCASDIQTSTSTSILEEVQEDMKSRCCEQADKLERSEEEMIAKTKAMGLLQADHDKLQVEVSRLREEKEALEKQVASRDAVVEELEKDKKALIDDMAGTFEEGFHEALAQAACVNPGIDVSSCDSTHHIVDGKVVPLDLDD